MKVAVLADTHGNIFGLERVAADIDAWRPDLVIVNGDIINRGPKNLDCWLYLKARAEADNWVLLRGNHEDYVIGLTDPETPKEGKRAELFGMSKFTLKQIGAHLTSITALPDRYGFMGPDGKPFFVTHGTMLGNRVGVFPDTEDDFLRRQISPAPSIFVTAHTHRPLVRTIDQTTVVNVGSAGLPFDGDRRLSYGRFTFSKSNGWEIEICRLENDIQDLEQALLESRFIPEAGPFAKLVLAEIRMARGIIGRWHRVWETAFMADEISLEESVDKLLSEPEFREFATPIK